MNNNISLDLIENYKYKLNEEDVIKFLLDTKIRNYLIENKCFEFIALIASTPNDQLRNFFFNDETIPLMHKFQNFYLALCNGSFYPNKIELLKNKAFLESLKISKNTYDIMLNIEKEIAINQENNQITKKLEEGIYNYINYLSIDLKTNAKKIALLLELFSRNNNSKVIDYIILNIKQYAINNKEEDFEDFFPSSSYYLMCYNEDFNMLYKLIDSFKEIENLYYCKSFVNAIIDKTTNYRDIIINHEEQQQFKKYIVNDKCKNLLLLDYKHYLFEKLYTILQEDMINYFLDDQALLTLYYNNNFESLIYINICFDKLTESNLFNKLLAKNENDETYDKYLKKITESFKNTKSVFNLLDTYLENLDYHHFFRVFINIKDEEQLSYIKINIDKLLSLNNNDLLKGMKKSCYLVFKDQIDIKQFDYSSYDLYVILTNMLNNNDYDNEQLITIFKNDSNLSKCLNSTYTEKIYKQVINLHNEELTAIFFSDESLTTLISNDKLSKIYQIIECVFDTSIQNLFLNRNCLIEVAEYYLKKFNRDKIDYHQKYPQAKLTDKYYLFLLNISMLKDKKVLFQILDFYLMNSKYLHFFYLLRNKLSVDILSEYLNIRKDLITKIIQEENNSNIIYILGNLPQMLIKREIFKERENFILYCDIFDYELIFNKNESDNIKLDESILNNDEFIIKFLYEKDLDKKLKLVTDDDTLVRRLILKINVYKDMLSKIQENLNDNYQDFKDYINILENSKVDILNNEFITDMKDVLFDNKNIKKAFFKYKNTNLESIKLDILTKQINFSRNNIVSHLTNPLLKDISYLEYDLDDKKVVIPTIILDKEPYIFLVRRVRNGEYFFDGTYESKVGCYSIITDKNRSVFHSDTGIKLGYININPYDIIHINSFDAISNNDTSSKYSTSYLKYAEWVSMEELNRRTLKRKSYKDAIEQVKDPYSNWK